MTEPSESAEPKTVLIVDDEPTFKVLLVSLLEIQGFRALIAADGPDALRLVREHGPNIGATLVDLNMRPMSGRQFLARLKQLSPHMPVVIMSGSAKEDVSKPAEKGNFPSFLQKPFSSEALAQAIRGAGTASAVQLS